MYGEDDSGSDRTVMKGLSGGDSGGDGIRDVM